MRNKEQSNEGVADGLSSDLSLFADQLAGFRPVVSRVDRDRILFEAGRASVESGECISQKLATRSLRRWQLATAGSSTAAVLMCALFLMVVFNPPTSSVEIARTAVNSRQNDGSMPDARSINEFTDVKSATQTMESRPDVQDSGISTTAGLEFAANRFQAMQVALTRSIDSKFDDARIWPHSVATGFQQFQSSDGRARPSPVFNGKNTQRMIDDLIEETQL